MPEPPCSQLFDAELRLHETALRAYLRRRFPALSDTDDIVQESLLKALYAWHRGKLTSTRGYIFTVARNLTVSLFRRQKFISSDKVRHLQLIAAEDSYPDVVETVCSDEELDVIASTISELPERCRQIAEMRILHGKSYPNIATELGISPQTVRVQIARAMKKCSESLRARGIVDEVQK